MFFKNGLLLVLVLVSAVGLGCYSGSGGGGGSSSNTIVGTWNLISSSGGAWPQQLVFNANGTGSNAGGNLPNASFTWTQSGNQIIIVFQGGSQATISLITPLSNNIILTDSSLRTASYARA